MILAEDKSTPIEELTKEMKTRRKTLLEKRTYVNDYKVSKKICEHPMCRDPLTNVPRVITFANAHAFQCAHVEDVDKEYTISSLVVNGQTLKTAKPAIDRELPKCKIYCANCHHLYDTTGGPRAATRSGARRARVCGVRVRFKQSFNNRATA